MWSERGATSVSSAIPERNRPSHVPHIDGVQAAGRSGAARARGLSWALHQIAIGGALCLRPTPTLVYARFCSLLASSGRGLAGGGPAESR